MLRSHLVSQVSCSAERGWPSGVAVAALVIATGAVVPLSEVEAQANMRPQGRAQQEARQGLRQARGEVGAARRNVANVRREGAREVRDAVRAGDRQGAQEARRELREELQEARAEAREERGDAREAARELGAARGEAAGSRADNRGNARPGVRRARRMARWRAKAESLGFDPDRDRPQALPSEVRRELRQNARRSARLRRMEALAEQEERGQLVERIRALKSREAARHARALRRLARPGERSNANAETDEEGSP